MLSRTLALAASTVVMLACAPWQMTSAEATSYPDRAVTMVVPFPAGGRTDLTGRSLAEGLEKHLGVPVAVVNKPGAGGVIGAKFVANAAPDGYTIGVFSSAVISAQYTVESGTNLGDYKVAALVEISPAAIAVQYDSRWQSLEDLVAEARAKPNSLTIGMIPGASAQVFAGGFVDAAGVEMTMVPFKGDAPGVNALAGGHIDVHVAVPASYKALSESKKVRMLAVAADTRLAQLPDVPTFKESGVDLVIGSFHAVFLPKEAPDEVATKLESALQATMQDPTVVAKMESVGLGPTYRDREGAAAFLSGHDRTYKTLITKLDMLHASKR